MQGGVDPFEQSITICATIDRVYPIVENLSNRRHCDARRYLDFRKRAYAEFATGHALARHADLCLGSVNAQDAETGLVKQMRRHSPAATKIDDGPAGDSSVFQRIDDHRWRAFCQVAKSYVVNVGEIF